MQVPLRFWNSKLATLSWFFDDDALKVRDKDMNPRLEMEDHRNKGTELRYAP